MFKSAATKIAHNSTLPALGVNKDLRPLQDLITAEKTVLISLQRLSVDLSKAADALRTWGLGEGEDLTDTLSASTNLLSQFSTALSNYASHEHGIREHMKAVRGREEGLDELKRRRKALISKADTAEKKLSKMSPEHKNLATHADALNRLRDDIRNLDSEIMSEEAALGDFKRSKARSWMGLKFGGLLECCEKGTIAGEFGRLVVYEIPEDTTQPGLPRAMYTKHPKVDSLVTDAMRCLSEVTFSTVPAPANSGIVHRDMSMTSSQGPSDHLPTPPGFGTGHFVDSSSISTHNPPFPQPETASRSTDDFGVSGPSQYDSPVAGRFATFPTKAQGNIGGYTLRDGPPVLDSHEGDDSFSSSIAAALGNGRRSQDDPAPSYESYQEHGSPPMPPPPGAAPPLMMEAPWADQRSNGLAADDRRQENSDEDTSLAYMIGNDEEPPSPVGHTRQASERQVHFGQVVDVDTELAKKQKQATAGTSGGDGMASPKRVPAPTLTPEEEERALNAAAAREVSRELDSLTFSPPPPMLDTFSDFGRERGSSLGSAAAANINREPSPLLPPQAPFAHRGPSPVPEDTGPLKSPYPEDDADQQYQQSPTSPTYGSGPRSPIVSNRSSSPARISLPERTSSSMSTSTVGGGGTPYRTPPEYPRSLGASPFGQRSTSSLGSGMAAPVPGGARTISAAAFRRPSPRAPSNDLSAGIGMGRGLADTSPLTLKKRLPSSPYPARSDAPSSEAPPYGVTGGRERADSRGSQIPAPHPPNDSYPQGNHEAGDDDHYDYLSAYTDPPGTGSPLRTDYGALGQVRVTNDYGMGSPGTPNTAGQQAGGYGDGRFATNLEGELR